MEIKEKIFTKALELFYQKGYDATGVQEIVDKCKVTKPTLYHYFGSKQRLLETILKQNNDKLEGISRLPELYDGDLDWCLSMFAKILFAFANENKKFYSMQMSMWFAGEKSTGHVVVEPYINNLYRIVEEIFTKATEKNPKLKGNEKLYAIGFIGMLNSYIAFMESETIVFDEQIVHKAIKQFTHGISSK